MKRIYLDYAASTPVDERVLAAMEPYFSEKFGNPSSLHCFGQEASAAVFNSRLKIARMLGCDYREIIFTGSATEANNLALRAIIKNSKIKNQNDKSKFKNFRPKIIISNIEHESVAETAADLERDGAEIVKIPVSKEGMVDLKKLKAALDERTILVSVMYANNEIGVVQPIWEIAKIIKDFKERQSKIASDYLAMTKKLRQARNNEMAYPLFHTDAVQAFQYLRCRPDELGVDLMTLSAHKIYGPKGIGMLYASRQSAKREARSAHIERFALSDLRFAIITGGEQEGGARAGTENVPYIVGFAKAVEIAEKLREKEARRVLKLREYFRKTSEVAYPKFEINGSLQNRLPNNLNIYFPGHKAQDLLIALDINGVAASSGSACSAHTTEPSKVIIALGYSCERALSSLRFSLGRGTTKRDIDKAISILVKYLQA